MHAAGRVAEARCDRDWGSIRAGLPGALALTLIVALALVLAFAGVVRAQDARVSQAPAAATATATAPPAVPPPNPDPFSRFKLPEAWEARFWSLPGVRELPALDPRALAALVPVQAGLRYCRCPGCDASEVDDPLGWSIRQPEVLTCRRCGLTVPNGEIPARDDKKQVPEETVEVLPGVVHHYPYHLITPEKQRYPDERLYLAAKRDYEARAFLAKAALYAAVRHHEQPPASRQPELARMAAVLVLRFAQVYPAYATHYDQPGEPKYFQQADLPPPYRRGYRTGKWDATANLDVPMNLLIAYALVRNDPALTEAGRVLDDAQPARTIEHDLFRRSAEFVRLQSEEFGATSLTAYRGMLAVGRLLGDAVLVHEALFRLGAFAERGFYHDGLWRQATANAHERVLELIEGWIDPLLIGSGSSQGDPRRGGLGPGPRVPEVPMLTLARAAAAVMLTDPRGAELLPASLPPASAAAVPRHPALLGGAGLARLALGQGQGQNALDIELRGLDTHGEPHFGRQAIRLSIGGHLILGDLDDLPRTTSGWDRATASHNTVVVDGLNQRESIAGARTPAPAGQFLFFAADPDFQVTALDDPNAYPQSTTRYRQTLIAAQAGSIPYAVSVFEVHGGLQHDQFYHAAAGAGTATCWQLPVALEPAGATLLPPSLAYLPGTRAEDGRWFVQSYGEFALQGQARISKPMTAWLRRPDGPGVRLHLLSSIPMIAYSARTTDPTVGNGTAAARAALVLRHRSESGVTLKTTFVTVFEPLGTTGPALRRVGRVASPADTVVIYVETAQGNEHLIVNLTPGTTQQVILSDGSSLRTDGLAVRVTAAHLVLAGGTFAEAGRRRTGLNPATGSIVAVTRKTTALGGGWFETDRAVPDPDTLVGRTLLIQHADATMRGWTLTRVENTQGGYAARLYVREEPGFRIDRGSGAAHYYQFPLDVLPGPHRFRISQIARASLGQRPAATDR
jgi:hypothetical protein